jgi:hypothetical protein
MKNAFFLVVTLYDRPPRKFRDMTQVHLATQYPHYPQPLLCLLQTATPPGLQTLPL